ncbi:GNAT family N-acetyltransferase [Brevibacillus sp. NRS-1366]|uniref:GNAT family N-acetyltransferase n=1 Tax=Brevibacillus sp. NRS-1366 TaxID=3233899 RepID=UPI003D20E655
MIQSLAITNQDTVQQIWILQQASYRVEAQLIGWDDLPPLRESVDDLMNCQETFVGYTEGRELAGAISFKLEGTTLDIHRMMVHPDHFRKGIASKLLQHVEKTQPDWQKMIVSTGALNEPAIKLYQRHGFRVVEQKAVAPGLELSFLEKLP